MVASTDFSPFLQKVAYIFQRGWRPATGWVCVVVLFVNGAIIPFYLKLAVDWAGVIPYATLLASLAYNRHTEKLKGTTDV